MDRIAQHAGLSAEEVAQVNEDGERTLEEVGDLPVDLAHGNLRRGAFENARMERLRQSRHEIGDSGVHLGQDPPKTHGVVQPQRLGCSLVRILPALRQALQGLEVTTSGSQIALDPLSRSLVKSGLLMLSVLGNWVDSLYGYDRE